MEDYVTRLRKAAKRLGLPQEVLLYAVINGLRRPIKLHMVQSSTAILEKSRAPCEAHESGRVNYHGHPVEDIGCRENTLVNEKLTGEIRELKARIATHAARGLEGQDEGVVAAMDVTWGRTDLKDQSQRRMMPAPQNAQRQGTRIRDRQTAALV